MAEDWAADVKKYAPDADDAIIAGIVRYCGIALQKRDSALVAFSDARETDRVRENYLKKKLGLTQSDAALNKAIAAVGARMKADRTKNRVTVYYLLAESFKKLSVFAKAAPKAAATKAATPKAAPKATPKAAPKAAKPVAAAKPVPAKAAAAKPAAATAKAAKPAAPAKAAKAPKAAQPAAAASAKPAKAAPAPAAKKAAAPAAKKVAAPKAAKPAAAAKAAPVASLASLGASEKAAESTGTASGLSGAAVAAGAATLGAASTVAASAVSGAKAVGESAVGAAGTAAAALGAAGSDFSSATGNAAQALSDGLTGGQTADKDEGGSGMGWLLWLLLALLALFLLWWLFFRQPADGGEAAGTATEAAAASTGTAAPAAIASAPSEGSATIPAGAGITSELRDGKPVVKVYFDTGKTALATAFPDAAAGLKDYLSANPGSSLAVSGYNDASGNAAANAELSKNRAQAVAAALVASGIAEASVALVKPEVTTDTAVSADAARRVEVVVK